MKHNKLCNQIKAEEFVLLFDSKFFKALSEPARIEILKYLIVNGRSDIHAIAQAMPQDRSVISRHLRFMHDASIVKCEKITRHMFYEVNLQNCINKVEKILQQLKQCEKI